jgi:hypothetical protein
MGRRELILAGRWSPALVTVTRIEGRHRSRSFGYTIELPRPLVPRKQDSRLSKQEIIVEGLPKHTRVQHQNVT